MKTMNNFVIRSICAILIGVLLVAWSDAAALYLVIAVGAMFFIPGIYTLVNYLMKADRQNLSFPLASLGSSLFGLWLMVMPTFFVAILMYVLGTILIFAGIAQLIKLYSVRRWAQVSVGYYIVPSLVLLAGLVVLFNPFAAVSIPFLILGISCIVYGIAELINQIKFRKQESESKIEEKEIVDVTPIE